MCLRTRPIRRCEQEEWRLAVGVDDPYTHSRVLLPSTAPMVNLSGLQCRMTRITLHHRKATCHTPLRALCMMIEVLHRLLMELHKTK